MDTRMNVGTRLATREQIYKIDRRAQEELRMTPDELVARAGHALADRILALPEFRDALPELRIGIWCGPGHNGADG
ncbi:MAG: hypothetical protein H7326_07415, partial [Bdellovibrionaceae bacterium]|nr:hypothetical protein [Pseudobdellovibrionaceae bacterium]